MISGKMDPVIDPELVVNKWKLRRMSPTDDHANYTPVLQIIETDWLSPNLSELKGGDTMRIGTRSDTSCCCWNVYHDVCVDNPEC